MSTNESRKYVIVGAGIHGLSTAWHLAMDLKSRGQGSGRDILVLEKSHVGAGATGVACGNVRNFYMTEALHPILKHSVDVWMHDPINFGFQQVGYVSCGEANQTPDFEKMHKSHNSVDYTSTCTSARRPEPSSLHLARLQDRWHRRGPGRTSQRLRWHPKCSPWSGGEM